MYWKHHQLDRWNLAIHQLDQWHLHQHKTLPTYSENIPKVVENLKHHLVIYQYGVFYESKGMMVVTRVKVVVGLTPIEVANGIASASFKMTTIAAYIPYHRVGMVVRHRR